MGEFEPPEVTMPNHIPQSQISTAQTPATTQPKREFVVLVTGFGPFSRAPVNSSHLLTKHLPDHLSILSPYNPTSLPIRILNPTATEGKYVKTEYAYIRTYIQGLYDEYADKVDALVHLGMADPWEWYSVEERAFNERFTSDWWKEREADEGYYMVPDAVGKTVRDIPEEGGKGMWDDMPLGLKAAKVNVRILVNDVKKAVNYEEVDGRENGKLGEEEKRKPKEKMKIDVISHDEAGNFGCGFIYYESLATCRRRKLNTRVVFCHVPGWTEPERLERGADFVCAVIGAVCRQINPSYPEQVMYSK